MEIHFSMSKQWVRSWLHVFLITNVKTFPYKPLEVHPEKVTRRKKRKTRMATAKLFVFHAKFNSFITFNLPDFIKIYLLNLFILNFFDSRFNFSVLDVKSSKDSFLGVLKKITFNNFLTCFSCSINSLPNSK